MQEIVDWFNAYADDIYRFALHTLGDERDAEDVVQEVFLRAIRARTRFRGDAHPRTWLFKIARFHLYDLLRRRRTQGRALSTYHLEHGYSEPEPIGNDVADLEEAFTSLRVDYRQVLSLRFFSDLSVAQTAKVLGWSEVKVRVVQHRALNELRKLWQTDVEGRTRGEGNR